MKVVDIADEIFKDLGEPSGLTVSSISSSLRSKVGDLNILICESFAVDSTTLEINDSDGVNIGTSAAAVLKQMYFVSYYNRRYLSNLTTMSSDLVLEVSDGGKTVRRMNRNEVGKTILQVKAQEEDTLRKMVNAYKMKDGAPRQVVGDDSTNYNVLSFPLDGYRLRRH